MSQHFFAIPVAIVGKDAVKAMTKAHMPYADPLLLSFVTVEENALRRWLRIAVTIQ